MDITGSYTFNAPPERVWALLMDPAVIVVVHSGLRALRAGRRRSLPCTLTVGLAAITGTYDGTSHSPTRCRTTSYRLIVEGQGRPGFVKGSVSDRAARQTATTTDRRRQRHGADRRPIARLGQRLIGGVAKMMQDRFFACLQSKLSV